jgi:RND family efflux transporter MFP subunit
MHNLTSMTYNAPRLPEGLPVGSETAPAAGTPKPRRRLRTGVVVFGALALTALAAALAVGILPRLHQGKMLESAARDAVTRPPLVKIVLARAATPIVEQVLPGDAQPLLEAAIYARTTGYLKKRYVDIGDQVQQDQLLAEIATPEIDAQLKQAQATLEQTRSNLKRDQAKDRLAKADLVRGQQLLARQGISQQEFDTYESQAQVATANVQTDLSTIKVNEAEVERLRALKSFQEVRAPFAGVITAKNVDPGALVTADSAGSSRELFHLMQLKTVRVMVNVPQALATAIRIDQKAVVWRKEAPDQTFTGKVTRTADALDLATRTLLTEIQVPNLQKALRPGMFLQVKFLLDRENVPVLVPTAALATRTGAPRVALLDAQRHVHYRTVQLGRDYGAEVEVTAGLRAGDTVVVHPGDDLPDGRIVEPVNPGGR